ncbi:MAG: hypothetical protein WBD36_08195 [Bacteroidota bacterium]
MKKAALFTVLALVSVSIFETCSTPPQTQKEEVVAKPELTFNIGSVNLSNFGKRMEKKDVVAFAKTLKKEQVEVLAVQGITRYPSVPTRVDFVSELSTQADMRSAFGEMMNNSGRQTGNAVFSTYPIRSNTSKSFDVKSATFEAVLQAVVDGGVRDILILSAQFPPKASADDQSLCVKSIVALNAPYEKKNPVIVAGNLPSSGSLRALGSFDDVEQMIGEGGKAPSRVWYASQGILKALSAHTTETDMGTMVVVQFGLFRQVQP